MLTSRCVMTQVHLLQLIKEGRNVFITGCAGTGKSFLLTRIIQHFEERFGQDCYARLAVTASALDALVRLCSRPLPVVGSIQHTELRSRSEGVDAVNAYELRALPSKLVCLRSCPLHAGFFEVPTDHPVVMAPCFTAKWCWCRWQMGCGRSCRMLGGKGMLGGLCMHTGDTGRI